MHTVCPAENVMALNSVFEDRLYLESSKLSESSELCSIRDARRYFFANSTGTIVVQKAIWLFSTNYELFPGKFWLSALFVHWWLLRICCYTFYSHLLWPKLLLILVASLFVRFCCDDSWPFLIISSAMNFDRLFTSKPIKPIGCVWYVLWHTTIYCIVSTTFVFSWKLITPLRYKNKTSHEKIGSLTCIHCLCVFYVSHHKKNFIIIIMRTRLMGHTVLHQVLLSCATTTVLCINGHNNKLVVNGTICWPSMLMLY